MELEGEKLQTFNEYKNQYTEEDRVSFCNIALKKFKFENYKLSDNNINDIDLIVTDQNTRKFMENIIQKNTCSENEFNELFKQLSMEQINYIGF